MFIKLFSLQWKTATRSTMWQKNVALNIVVGFFLLLFSLYLLLLGLFIDQILGELFPDRSKTEVFNGFLIYYFLADIFMRFLMQGLPRLNVESFLHLPIRKSRLVHYIVSRTVADVFNLVPLFVLVPVLFTMIVPNMGVAYGLRWILVLFMMILGNNFLATWFKRELGAKPVLNAIIGVFILAIVLLEKFEFISLSITSSAIFGFLASNAVYTVIPLAWMIVTYYTHYRFLKAHLYPDEMQVKKNVEVQNSATDQYLRTLGLTGSIALVEMKLYWRNKRTRTILYMLPVFLLYGLLFYPNSQYINQNGFLMFVGVFVTGGMMLNYANYAFGYESGYFDCLLTRSIDFYQYIRVKYYISVLISTVCYILTIPYVFFGPQVLFINTAMYLYNIGVLSYILLFMATYNKKRMELSRGGAFNYQGIGAMNWLATVPAFLLPLLLYIPFSALGYRYLGIAFTGFLGILGLTLNGVFLKKIGQNFFKRKYAMAAGFRERG
jgi:hypothetical protein